MRKAPQEIRTFFVTSVANGRSPLFKKEAMACLFLDVLQDNRRKGRYLLHEFVIMPDHFHLIVTPVEVIPLEKTLQYIKGGFSFRVKKELAFQRLVWQESFTNHRIRDAEDYQRHREYIHLNPVEASLVKKASEYPYSWAFPGMELDPAPPALKRVF
jgi:putative transposase